MRVNENREGRRFNGSVVQRFRGQVSVTSGAIHECGRLSPTLTAYFHTGQWTVDSGQWTVDIMKQTMQRNPHAASFRDLIVYQKARAVSASLPYRP